MRLTIAFLISSLLFAFPALSIESKSELSSGQTVYVSIYSNIFTNVGLAGMLSIRNTDLHNPLTILSSKYYDNNGKELKEYVQKPITLEPLGSTSFSVKEDDKSGGFGANFIVKWKADKDINPPVVESIMIGMREGKGISFVSQGKVISENTK